MSDALKIMDEIERHHKLRPLSWRKLRAAIKSDRNAAASGALKKMRDRIVGDEYGCVIAGWIEDEIANIERGAEQGS